METASRFTAPIRFRNDIETHADLDSCAEVDLVSYQFVQLYKLQAAKMTAPLVEAVNQLNTPSYGVWKVPFYITDSRGTTQYIERPCVAINRDPSLLGSPILLSMTTLQAYHIHLSPYNYQWWFETPQIKALNRFQFAKECRNHAYVFAITKMPEEIWLPDEPDVDPVLNTQGLPTEFQAFQDVFSSDNAAALPPSRATDHAITMVEGESPPWGPIYPLSQKELNILRQYLDEFLASGRIRPSKSPAGAPIIFVPKKDGSLRLCIDYRGLNKVTVKNRYPLPLISEIMDRLSGSKYFTKIDLKDAYYRIRIREEDQWKTAFRTRYGHFEFIVMPMGLTNAPATFQNYINTALYDILDHFCIVYLDDILIFSSNRESHTSHTRQVLERLRKADLYAKLSKCSFYQNYVEFLGYVVSQDGISMDHRRVNDIISWEEPQSYHDVQVFLGFCNFYRRFIYNYSRIALPLTNLLKGSKEGKKPGRLKFTLKEKIAFRRLIAAFQSAPLLRHFDPERAIRIETDASDKGMAGIMSQPDNKGVFHPIAFWSKKFSGAELNYSTPDQELFAIVWSFKHWRHYLEGSLYPIEVFSDHANLQSFMKQPKINGRQARWCLYLTPFDFIIKHKPGKSNPADGPSRCWPTRSPPEFGDIAGPIRERIAAVESLQIRDLWAQKAQDSYPSYQSKTGTKPLDTRMALSSVRAGKKSADWAVWDSLSSDQALSRIVVQQACTTENLYKDEANKDLKSLIYRLQADDPTSNRRKSDVQQRTKKMKGWSIDSEGGLRYRKRLYIPPCAKLRQKILNLYHDDPLAGHFGRNRTEELVKRKFHWEYMQKDIANYVQECPVCQGTIAPRHKPYGKLESLPIPTRPFEQLAMDFITSLPSVEYKGNIVDSILVIVDRFTKWCLFLPVSSMINVGELAELFHTEVELKYGPPKGVVSDRGSLFTSKFWSKLCYYSHIKLRLSTAYHPQTDGQTERMNQILEHYLRCFIDTTQTTWPKLLPNAQFSCNNAINSTTGISPFEALRGYQADFHIDIEDDITTGEVPAATDRVQKLQQLRRDLQNRWRKATEAQANQYNKRHKPFTFKRGDLVKLSTRNLKLKTNKKLSPTFIGPFRVLNAIGSQAYRLSLPSQYDRIHNVFHISLLEPWYGSTDEELPMPELDDNDEWEVEEIKAKTMRNKELYYLVKWKGWPSEYNQWVFAGDMAHAPKLVKQFEKSIKKTPRY